MSRVSRQHQCYTAHNQLESLHARRVPWTSAFCGRHPKPAVAREAREGPRPHGLWRRYLVSEMRMLRFRWQASTCRWPSRTLSRRRGRPAAFGRSWSSSTWTTPSDEPCAWTRRATAGSSSANCRRSTTRQRTTWKRTEARTRGTSRTTRWARSRPEHSLCQWSVHRRAAAA